MLRARYRVGKKPFKKKNKNKKKWGQYFFFFLTFKFETKMNLFNNTNLYRLNRHNENNTHFFLFQEMMQNFRCFFGGWGRVFLVDILAANPGTLP